MSSSPGEETDVVRLNNMVCFNLHAASRAVTAVYRSLLEPLGLTYPQYLVLATLWECGNLSVGELIQRLQLDYGTMTPLLKRMEKRGLVHRTRNPKDERTVIVSLAPDGEVLRTHSPGIYQAICDTFEFTPERAQAAQSVLLPIVERANKHNGVS
ncbi:MarR family winged helix-turn-helix transcriptional regulator [Rhodococcus sp. NPDC059968]|uniref:MarR family winged helix-turn-helix transcriptional regulator n=1 Tax=Rhodococcus sp. NPDC059968 TaxID=3347017 RepID=UPI00366AB77E